MEEHATGDLVKAATLDCCFCFFSVLIQVREKGEERNGGAGQLTDALQQLPALRQVHDEEEAVVRAEGLMQGHHVGVAHPLQDVNLRAQRVQRVAGCLTIKTNKNKGRGRE